MCGVRLQSGEFLPADRVIFNGDVQALRNGLLGDAVRDAVPQPAPARSLSAMTWSMHTTVVGAALDRHNVFFQSDYASEFDDIFARQRQGQTRRLDGGHLGVAELIEVGEGVGGEGQCAEGLGHAAIISGLPPSPSL